MARTFRWFRPLIRPYRRRLTGAVLLILVVAVADLAAPWPLKVIVDNVLGGEPVQGGLGALLGGGPGSDPGDLLAPAIGMLLLIVAIGAVADYSATFLSDGVGERLRADLRERIFAHLQRMSLSYHDRQRVGDLTTRITGDVDHVGHAMVAYLSDLVPNVLFLAGMVVVMLAVDPVFGLLSLSVAPLLFLTIYSFTRRIRRASKVARRTEGEVASVAGETLASIRVVQAYTGEPIHQGRFRDRNRERLTAGLTAVRVHAKLSPLVDFISAVGTALVLWIGVRRVQSGEMTLGILLVFLRYISMLYRPMRSLSKLAAVIARGQASAERIAEILSADIRVVEREGARVAPALRGEIRIDDVIFGYEHGSPVLNGVTLEAVPGEMVGLAGPTGAGKSTLVALIPRLYDPWEGQVLVDGIDVRHLTLRSLRGQVALVLQDSLLFHGTIHDNIAYGREGATEDEVLAAAEAAFVDEFVRALPDGYDTVVSERGTTLSGGQRQRIAIARALVRDAPIVILDEPTSGLDAVSEQYVLRGMERLMKGRTVLLVAHRLSTLRRADRIYVLDGGAVVDHGAHDELIRRAGLYRQMHVAMSGAETSASIELGGRPGPARGN